MQSSLCSILVRSCNWPLEHSRMLSAKYVHLYGVLTLVAAALVDSTLSVRIVDRACKLSQVSWHIRISRSSEQMGVGLSPSRSRAEAFSVPWFFCRVQILRNG